MLSLTAQFTAWVRTKDADEEYDFWSVVDCDDGCPLTQFVRHLGLSADAQDGHRLWMSFPSDVGIAASAPPHTFGALADRLSGNLS